MMLLIKQCFINREGIKCDFYSFWSIVNNIFPDPLLLFLHRNNADESRKYIRIFNALKAAMDAGYFSISIDQ